MSKWLFNANSIFPAVSWREPVTFRWDDDGAFFWRLCTNTRPTHLVGFFGGFSLASYHLGLCMQKPKIEGNVKIHISEKNVLWKKTKYVKVWSGRDYKVHLEKCLQSLELKSMPLYIGKNCYSQQKVIATFFSSPCQRQCELLIGWFLKNLILNRFAKWIKTVGSILGRSSIKFVHLVPIR